MKTSTHTALLLLAVAVEQLERTATEFNSEKELKE